MKKAAIILIILMTTVFISNAHAYNLVDKLARGAFNILVSPLELFQALSENMEERDPALGVTCGIATGAWRTVRRAGVGFFEVVTFWIPLPDYGPLIEQPVFLAEKKLIMMEEEEKKKAKAKEDALESGTSNKIE